MSFQQLTELSKFQVILGLLDAVPGQVTDLHQAGQQVVEQLLNCKTVCCQTYYLVTRVLWHGNASADDLWKQATGKNVTNWQLPGAGC